MPHVLRCLALVFLAVCLAAADKPAAVLTMDDIYGRWVPDVAAMDAALKKDAAEAIKKDEEWSLTLTPRVGRLARGEEVIAGLCRLDAATAKSGTLVIEPKGGEPHTFTVTYDGKHLFIADLPWKIPFTKAK